MVEFITYKGEKYPIRVSYYVLMTSEKETGTGITDINSNYEAQQSILWYALVAGHKMADKELTLKREDIIWILDESYLDFQRIYLNYAKSLIDVQTDAFKMSSDKKK